MRAFLAHFELWLQHNESRLREAAFHELPKGVTVQDFLSLSRKAFFNKLATAFAEQAEGAAQIECP
jgi:hypothetical protein